jgi:hypothetical protein
MAWKYNTCEIKIVQSCFELCYANNSIDRQMGFYFSYKLVTFTLLHGTTYFTLRVYQINVYFTCSTLNYLL